MGRKDHHGSAGRKGGVERDCVSNVACAVASASGDAPVGGATTTSASALSFGVNPVQTKTIIADPHTRADTDIPWRRTSRPDGHSLRRQLSQCLAHPCRTPRHPLKDVLVVGLKT